MARDKDLWIIPLICTGCGGRLISGAGSVMFPCAVCATLWEAEGEALQRRDLHVLAGEGSVYLPFWLFPFEVSAGGETITTLAQYRGLTGNINPLEQERLEKPPLVFVPAGSGMAPHLLVRAGRLLTIRSPALRRANLFPEGLNAVGVRERDAALVAPIVVLATMTEQRRRSLPFLQSYSVKVGSGRLCAIPFERQGERLQHAEWSVEF